MGSEVHAYNGQYYLFATINSDIKWKKVNWLGRFHFARHSDISFHFTGGAISCLLTSFLHTPDMMALDGTLWVEDGKPIWSIVMNGWNWATAPWNL